jgi:SH3-like domain-containing protein
MNFGRRLFLAGLAASLPALAVAQDDASVGPATGLPMPRFVSLKSSEANVRRGPSLNHRVDWVFRHRGTPLEITAEFENWRRVRDADGAGGWVHYTLLSGVRTVLVRVENSPLYDQPRENSNIRARAEDGVIARLGSCTLDWCELSVDGNSGWMPKSVLWGVSADEIRD